MKTPRLGIAIVHFRAEDLLAQCLDRLRNSLMVDFAVCVVDCGSRSDISPLLPDERFELLDPGANRGFAAGSNLAFAQLPGDCPWLLTLNPDVMVEPETLGRVLDELDADPVLGAMTCRLELPSGRIDKACRRSEPKVLNALAKLIGLQAIFPRCRCFGGYNLSDASAESAHDIDSGSGAFLMLRRSALTAAGGGFDERFFLYGEDLDLCRRVRQAGYRLRYIPTARALHIKGSGRVRSLSATFHFYRAMWLYYRKWGRQGHNPLVLAPLAMGLLVLGGLAMLSIPLRCMLSALRRHSPP